MVIVGTGFLGGEGSWNRQKGGQGGSAGGFAGDEFGDELRDKGGGLPPSPVTGRAGGAPPPPAAVVWPYADGGCRSWSSRLLISGVVGIAGGRLRRVVGTGVGCNGLPNCYTLVY